MADDEKDYTVDPDSSWGSPIGINPDGTANIVGYEPEHPPTDEEIEAELMEEPEGLDD